MSKGIPRYTCQMKNQDFLTNHFLVAMPTLDDPNFQQSVAFICEHNDQGALGIIINRPSNVVLGDIFEQLSIDASNTESSKLPVWQGGPVQLERGFVIHSPAGAWEATLKLAPDLGVTSSRDVLDAIARGAGPEKLFVALGYAGWAAGQLEAELAELDEAEAGEFLASYGLTESALARLIRSSYHLLGLISFFTVGEDECRAWTIRAGTSAVEAAGEIHTDLQKGFIRAEVVKFEDLVASGSMAEARNRGTLKLEGKEYVVQDGEIVHIRHSG